LILLVVYLIFADQVLSFITIPLVRREKTVISRKKSYNNPLTGVFSQTLAYSALIKVGGNNFYVDFDTGSYELFLASTSCVLSDTGQVCTSASLAYTPSSSAVLLPCSNACDMCDTSNTKCLFYSSYGDGSNATGTVYNDTITIGTYTAVGAVAAMYSTVSTFLATGTSGLWGVGFTPSGGVPTAIDSLVAAGMPNIFSIFPCANGGIVTFGGIDNSYAIGTTYQYSPLVPNTGYYTIANPVITIGGNSVTVASSLTTIVDSGTTNIVLPQSVYNSFMTTMQNVGCAIPNMCGDTSIFTGACYDVSTFPFSQYPNITFTLTSSSGTFNLILTPSNYMFINGNCLTLSLSADTSGGTTLILGDTFMNSFYVVFDRQNSQVGFAPSNQAKCSSSFLGTSTSISTTTNTTKSTTTSSSGTGIIQGAGQINGTYKIMLSLFLSLLIILL